MINSYQIGERAKAKRDFERVFQVNIAPFYDRLITVLFQKIQINTFIFDDFLHKIYGNYEDEGLNMEEIIIEKYGKEGLELINKLT